MKPRMIGLCITAVFAVSCSAAQPKGIVPVRVPQVSQVETGAPPLQDLRSRAEQGNAEAQFNLAQAYDHGRGVSVDQEEAVRWYRLAAGQGDPFAQFDLGNHYSEGLGVAKDEKEAVRWWQLAANQGFPPAQYSLGKVLVSGGQGVSSDKLHAYVWLTLSSAQGNEEATQARQALSKQLTPAQVTKAKRLVKQWKPASVSVVVTKSSK